MRNFPDSRFHKQKFPGFRKDSLTWGELKVVYSTVTIISTFISLSVVQNISCHFIYLLSSVLFPPSSIKHHELKVACSPVGLISLIDRALRPVIAKGPGFDSQALFQPLKAVYSTAGSFPPSYFIRGSKYESFHMRSHIFTLSSVTIAKAKHKFYVGFFLHILRKFCG